MVHVCYGKGCLQKHPYFNCPHARKKPDAIADATPAAKVAPA